MMVAIALPSPPFECSSMVTQWKRAKGPSSLSSSLSMAGELSLPSLQIATKRRQLQGMGGMKIEAAAYTRRSGSELAKKPKKKSWSQRADKYMKPFSLDIMISKNYIVAKVMHRVTSKVVSVATTNARDLRESLPSRIDVAACKAVGRLLADRTKEADVFAVMFSPKKNEKQTNKIQVILDTIVENEIALV